MWKGQKQMGHVKVSQGKMRKATPEECWRITEAVDFICADGNAPYLAAAFSNMRVLVDEACTTAYTDCRYRVALSPLLLDRERCSIEHLAFVLLHEAMHSMQRHDERFDKAGKDKRLLANYAADLETNRLVLSCLCSSTFMRSGKIYGKSAVWNFLLPGGRPSPLSVEEANQVNSIVDANGFPLFCCVYKAGEYFYDGALIPGVGIFRNFPLSANAEQYSHLLKSKSSDMSAGTQHARFTGKYETIYRVEVNGALTRLDSSMFESDIVCDERFWESADAIGVAGLSDSDIYIVSSGICSAASSYKREQTTWSSNKNDLLNAVISYTSPTIRWEDELSAALRTFNVSGHRLKNSDYSYKRPSSRYSANGYIFPSLVFPKPNVLAAVDTSGSMINAVSDALVQVKGLIRKLGYPISFVCLDTEIRSEQKIRKAEEGLAHLIGGGGTDMEKVIEYVEHMAANRRPDVIVLLTDGLFSTSQFAKRFVASSISGIQLIMIIVGDHGVQNCDCEAITEQLMEANKKSKCIRIN